MSALAPALSSTHLHDGTVIVTSDDDATTRYVVWQDDAAHCDSPNGWAGATAYVYSTSSHSTADDADDTLSEVFFRVYGEHGDDALALAVTRRYARVTLGWAEAEAEARIVTYSARGYSQSDWWDILSIDPRGYAEDHAHTWEQWARGDVFAVMAEERIECASEECHGDDDAHWEPGDACGGIYADDAEDAVSHYLANN